MASYAEPLFHYATPHITLSLLRFRHDTPGLLIFTHIIDISLLS
jgi:hypothetical protein